MIAGKIFTLVTVITAVYRRKNEKEKIIPIIANTTIPIMTNFLFIFTLFNFLSPISKMIFSHQ